jgi:predicted nucleic acid-binding protein
MNVFVDTWAWYALADRNDRDHEIARIANEDLLNEENLFVTTNYVVSEATTLIRYNLCHSAAVQFRRLLQELMDAELVTLIRVTKEIESRAGQIFEEYDDQDFSFVDCTSFAVMHSLEISTAFSGDKHFATMGFNLRP